MTYYPINEQTARTAKQMMSFDEYREGSATAEYRAMVDHAAEIAEEAKRRVEPVYHDKIDALLDQYARRMADSINRENEIGTRCPSVMIAGGSNFPTKKKEKQNAAWDACYRDRQDIDKLLDRIRSVGHGGISADDPAALDKLRAKLAEREAEHEEMKRINAYFRRNGGSLEGCPGLTADQIAELSTGFNMDIHGAPYPGYLLSLNNAEIHRLRDRIAELEKRQTASVSVGWTFDGGRVEADNGDNRLRVYFDDKPDAATRDELKSHGFRWSPNAGAWQRQLTDNAIYTARNLIKCIAPTAEPAEVTETADDPAEPAETAETETAAPAEPQPEPAEAETAETAEPAEPAEPQPEPLAEQEQTAARTEICHSVLYTVKRQIIILTLDETAAADGTHYDIAATSGNAYIARETLDDLTAAVERYNDLIAQYTAVPNAPTPSPLTGKYAKLRDDLIAALAAGRAAEEADPEDGGTCNLDATAVLLPRWNRALVKQAAEAAGTDCFNWDCYGQHRFVFIPNSSGQANARCRNAEAMTAALSAAGYDAHTYQQMD